MRRLSYALQYALLASLGVLTAGRPLPAQSRPVKLVIAATTDVHGRVRGWDYYANAPDPARTLAGAATIVDSLRATHPGGVVLVEGGDILQGNPLTYVAARVTPQPVHPVIAAMNVMRYDAAVLGNHEFNYGVPLLRDAMRQAAFPFLAANVREASGKPFAVPYTIVERHGVRIGIVGGTTPGSMIWDKDNLRDARLTVTDIVPAVGASVRAARRLKADVIIVLLHSGLDEPASYDTTATGLPSENVAARIPREIDGIDVVVYGHSHRELVDSTINGALLMQPRNWAASVAVATLSMERVKGRWTVMSRKGQSVRVAGHREAPDVLAATTGSHRATLAWVNAPIGRTAVAWRSDSARVRDMPITDLVNSVMRRKTGAQLSATAAFSLDAALDSGTITQAAISKLYPYDNTLRAVRISGAQLKAFLEHSARYYRSVDANGRPGPEGLVDLQVPGFNFDVVTGADYSIDLRQPVGARITTLSVEGREVLPTDSFTMALNNYRQGGGGGYAMLAGAPVVFDGDVDIRQLLIDEVRQQGTLDPARYASRNWSLLPETAVAAAYEAQHRGRAAESSGRAPGAAAATAAPRGTPLAGQRTLRVIAMSDFHGALRNRPDNAGRTLGGAVALSAAIERARAECTDTCQSMVVDAGDLFTGTPASDWDAGRPTVAVLNQLHVIAGALGNHEFDFGQDTLRMRLAELRYPVLGANVRGPDGARPAWLRSDTMITVGAVRVGVIGTAGTHTASSTKMRNVRGLTFVDPAPIISERVRALRAAGAQVVVSIIHDGGRCERDQPTRCAGGGIDVANRLTDKPDVFVMGHAHVNMTLRVNGMPVVEPSSSGRAIVVVDVPLDGGEATMAIRTVSADSVIGASVVVDSIVRASIAKVQERIQRSVATFAEAMPRRGRQYALGNLIADAARVMGNADFALWNNGGIRADVGAGRVTVGTLHEVTPFSNVLVRLRMRGDALQRAAERWVANGDADSHVSGLLVTFDPTRARDARVVSLRLTNGAPLDPARIYSIVINDYMLDDPGSGFTVNITHEILPIRDIDMLQGYLQRLPQPVRGDTTARIRPISSGTSK